MPQKLTPFSERVAAARVRRQTPQTPVVDRSANDKIIDDYFGGGGEEEDQSWKSGALKIAEKYNPFSIGGLTSDLSDLGHKITHPIETMAPGGPFARGLGRGIKAVEDVTGGRPSGYGVTSDTGLAHNAPGDFVAGAARTVKNVARGARGAAQDYRDVVEANLPDVLSNLKVGPSGGDAIAARSTIEGFLGGTRQGTGQMARGLTEDPLSAVDPGIREAVKNRSGSIPYKLGRVAPPLVGLLAPTKAGTMMGDMVKGTLTAPLKINEAIQTGRAARAAAEEATQISRQAQVGRSSSMMPVHPSRQLPGFGQTSNVGTMFRGSGAGMIPPDPNIVGPIEFHSPQPVSAGMGGTTAAQMPPSTRAFEALVPNRYKSDVTATGLNVPKLGDVTGPPTPGLPVVTERGVLRGQAAKSAKIKGTTGLPEMVQQYGLEEAANRARMTVEELQGMLQGQAQPSVEDLATKGLASLKEKPLKPSQTKASVPFQITKDTRQQLYDLGHTKAQVNAMSPEAAQQAVSAGSGPTRMFKNATDQTLQTLAGRGNQDAVREVALRRGGLSRLSSETGAVGRDIQQRKIGGRSPGEALQRLMENEEGKIDFTNTKLEDFVESWKQLLASPRNSIGAEWGRQEARYAGSGPPGLQKGDPTSYGPKVFYRDSTGKPVISARLAKNWDDTFGITSMGADPDAPMGIMKGAMNAVVKHLVDDLGVRGSKGTVSPYTRNFVTKMIKSATGKTEAELNEMVKATAGHGPVKPGGEVFETPRQKKWQEHMRDEGHSEDEIKKAATDARNAGVHYEYADSMDYLQEAMQRAASNEYYPTGKKIEGAASGKLNRMLSGQENFPRDVQAHAQRSGTDLYKFQRQYDTEPGKARLAYRKFVEEMKAAPPAPQSGPFTTQAHHDWAADMEDYHDPHDIRGAAQRATAAGVDFTQYGDLGDLEDAISQARSAARSSFAQGQSSSFGTQTSNTGGVIAGRPRPFTSGAAPGAPPRNAAARTPLTPEVEQAVRTHAQTRGAPRSADTILDMLNDPDNYIGQDMRTYWENRAGGAPVGQRDPGGRIPVLSRMWDETGSVGPGTEGLMRGRMGNERGAVSFPSKAQLKDWGKKGVNTANEIRLASMLSGWALPKSLLGNVGAHGVAAIEDLAAGKGMKSLDPIKEGLRLPTNFKNAWKYYKQGQSPQITQMMGPSGKASWINQPARIMGAFNEASKESLMRSGKTLEEAQRLQLQDPRYGLKGPGSPMMNYLVPFRKTPFNVLQGGGRTMAEHPLLSLGAMGAGATGGMASDDPRAIGLMAALFGPYTLPFMMGAGTTAGLRALQGISPIPEWSITKSMGDPLSPFQEPSMLRMFEEPGQAPQTSREKMLKREKRGKRELPKRNR